MKKHVRLRARPLWRCPRCGRQFAKVKQWHSCRVHNVDDHFRGKDLNLRRVFEALVRHLERSGPLRIDAVKSTINLVSHHHFAGVSVRREHLRVGFILDHEIDDERIARRQRIGPRRVSHHVQVRALEDVDAQLLHWLAAAQAMQARGV